MLPISLYGFPCGGVRAHTVTDAVVPYPGAKSLRGLKTRQEMAPEHPRIDVSVFHAAIGLIFSFINPLINVICNMSGYKAYGVQRQGAVEMILNTRST